MPEPKNQKQELLDAFNSLVSAAPIEFYADAEFDAWNVNIARVRQLIEALPDPNCDCGAKSGEPHQVTI
jgi:hypothetical protein